MGKGSRCTPPVGTSLYLRPVFSVCCLTRCVYACHSHQGRSCHLHVADDHLFPLHCPVSQPDPLSKPVRMELEAEMEGKSNGTWLSAAFFSRMKKLVWKDVPNPKQCSWARGLDLDKVQQWNRPPPTHPDLHIDMELLIGASCSRAKLPPCPVGTSSTPYLMEMFAVPHRFWRINTPDRTKFSSFDEAWCSIFFIS